MGELEQGPEYTAEELEKVPTLDIISYGKLVKHLAKEIETCFDIPYLVPIVQSAHESRNGNSGLCRKYCNLFGITATKSWTDQGRPICSMPTFEFIKGKRVDMSREFRAYHSWKESFLDWALLISKLNVYKTAYAKMRDGSVKEGIQEMAKAYATDPKYAEALTKSYVALSGIEI